MRLTRIVAAVVVGYGLFTAVSAMAQNIDPSTIHIGNGVPPASCPTGGCGIFNGNLNGGGTQEVNSITTQLDIYQESNGQSGNLTSPMLLILAVPNGTSSSLNAGSISNPKLFEPYTAATGTPVSMTFGTTAFSLDNKGFEGIWSSQAQAKDIYAFLGTISSDTNFDGTNSSSNFGNLQLADANFSAATKGADANITANSFAVFVYAFTLPPNVLFGQNDAINVDVTGIPVGTFAFGYGEANLGVGSPNPFDTPMTETGIETQSGGTSHQGVPEPGSLVLLGSALFGFGILGRRRRRI